jgi:chromate transport protein ChrA
MYQHGVKKTLKAGSAVFGASAIFLIVTSKLFLDLLDLESNDQMVWSMRMIAITLLALAGNMWQNSKITNNAAALKYVGIVMVLAASALGFLTIFIPATLNPFTIGYAAIGFSFALVYLINLIKKP